MRGLRIDTMLGTMNVQPPAPAAAASALALPALRPSAGEAAAIGFGGLALGVGKSAQQARSSRDAAPTASPVSYLYHLHRDLNPVGLAERLRHATARFTPPGP